MSLGAKTPDVGSRTYTEIMREQLLRGEESDVRTCTHSTGLLGALQESDERWLVWLLIQGPAVKQKDV